MGSLRADQNRARCRCAPRMPWLSLATSCLRGLVVALTRSAATRVFIANKKDRPHGGPTASVGAVISCNTSIALRPGG